MRTVSGISMAFLGAAFAAACSSSSNNSAAGSDAGNHAEAGVDANAGDGGGMTIAKARAGSLTTPFTVTAVVTAVRGDNATDTKEWYIEDPEGGPNSGIAVWCDKTMGCPMSVAVPNRFDLIQITGSIVPYQGRAELDPTAQTSVSSNHTPPPVGTVEPTDLAASGNSQWRGVMVKLAAAKLTVDDATPASIYDSKCADAGASDAGTSPGGMSLCTGCAPPTYAGFQVNDGAGHEIIVENHFYNTCNLVSSPECLTQMGAVDVMKGMTFSLMTGIVDIDPAHQVQYIAPVLDSDYKTP